MAEIRLSRIESSAFKNSSYAGPSVSSLSVTSRGVTCAFHSALSCETLLVLPVSNTSAHVVTCEKLTPRCSD